MSILFRHLVTILFTIHPDMMYIKYTILSTAWPLKEFLVEGCNLIKMLSSSINKFKNLTKYSKSEH